MAAFALVVLDEDAASWSLERVAEAVEPAEFRVEARVARVVELGAEAPPSSLGSESRLRWEDVINSVRC